ncbi:MAG: ABC transporter ATP-binding protein [Candidatus Paceibacterota bacterium]|jgi:ABC-type branched-subunit amino acid transport system ATPase component
MAGKLNNILAIENLRKSFGGVHAVDDCSFEVERGKITALIGPNGSGKTTVFNLVSGVTRADGGKIILDGKNLTHLSPHLISNLGLSRVFQQSRLFANLTVEENLMLAFDNEDQKFWQSFLGLKNKNRIDKKKIIGDYLELVRLGRMRDKQARDLSFGQKRLVEILRALINPHNLLMLDEPVAGVTPELRDKIKEVLLDLKKKGETILLIEHDMNFTLKVSDWVIVMDAGQVIAEGTPDEIRHNPKVLEAYLD